MSPGEGTTKTGGQHAARLRNQSPRAGLGTREGKIPVAPDITLLLIAGGGLLLAGIAGWVIVRRRSSRHQVKTAGAVIRAIFKGLTELGLRLLDLF